MAARPDFAVPLALIGIGLSVAIPRLRRDGPLAGSDWIWVLGGLGVAAAAVVVLLSGRLKR
jgi:hypothetical protein